MAIANKHDLYGVYVGDTVLKGVRRVSQPIDTTIGRETTGGDVSPRFASISRQTVRPSWSTLAIAQAVGLVPYDGKAISSLTDSTLALYGYAHDDEASRTAGAAHKKYAYTSGIIINDRLSAADGGDAELSQMAYCKSPDGANAPVTLSESQAVPAAATDDERFTLGPVTLGGESITQIRSLEIDFGCDVVCEAADSDLWETFCSIRRIMPTIRLRGINLHWFKDDVVPLLGVAAAQAATTIYLRRRVNDSTIYANNQAQHISIKAAGPVVIESAQDGSSGEATECTLRMDVRYDGVNSPLVIATSQTIS